MTPYLSDFDKRVLHLCAGTGTGNGLFTDPAKLKASIAYLQGLGLVYFTYDDDQPTHYATERGVALLAAPDRTSGAPLSPPPPKR